MYPPPPQPSRSGPLTALVAGAVIALVAANIYLYVQIDHLRTDVATVRQDLMNQLSSMRDASSVTTASQKQHIDTLKQELAASREQLGSQARTLSSQAKAEAIARTEQLTQQIKDEEARTQQRVSTELSEVKNTAAAASSKINDVSTDVTGVKSK